MLCLGTDQAISTQLASPHQSPVHRFLTKKDAGNSSVVQCTTSNVVKSHHQVVKSVAFKLENISQAETGSSNSSSSGSTRKSHHHHHHHHHKDSGGSANSGGHFSRPHSLPPKGRSSVASSAGGRLKGDGGVARAGKSKTAQSGSRRADSSLRKATRTADKVSVFNKNLSLADQIILAELLSLWSMVLL